jgi:hypothetical protein
MSKKPISVEATIEGLKAAGELPGLAGAELRKQVYTAMNQATNDGKSAAAKNVSKKIFIAQKNVKPFIKQTKRATNGNLQTELTVAEGKRISLKYFSPRKTRRGISYRINRSGGRGEAIGAFGLGNESKRLGGHIYQRTTKKRLPIVKLFGPSTWGVFAINNMEQPTSDEMLNRFNKRLAARARYINLKRTGGLR